MRHPLLLLALLAPACNVERPGAGEDYQSPRFSHAAVSGETCASCHEKDRPAPFKETPHGGGKDCQTCHNPSDDRKGWLPRRAFDHQPAPSSCLDCHIKQRPEPPHAETGDCAGCHQYPAWK